MVNEFFFMNKRLLILISALVVAGIGGGLWYWMHRDQVGQALNGNQNTNATVSTNTGNTNRTTPTNLNLSSEQKGDIAMDEHATIGGVDLHFSSVSKVDSYEGDPAGVGNSFLVVYFDGLPSSKVLGVKQAIDTGALTLTSAKGFGTIATVKVASDIVKNDRGYIKFIVKSDESGFSLNTGAGDNVHVLKLPI